MKKRTVDEVYEKTYEKIAELSTVSIDSGLHIDYDFEGELFVLLLKDDLVRMQQLNKGISQLIEDLKSGNEIDLMRYHGRAA